MNDEENDSEEKNNAANNDVANAEKRVLASQQRSGWNDYQFTSFERLDWVIYQVDLEFRVKKRCMSS